MTFSENKFVIGTKDFVMTLFKAVIRIATIIGGIYGLRWLGLKGIFGLMSGMMLMGYLILSDNKIFYAILRVIGGKSLNEETSIIKEEIRKERPNKVKFLR